jgi:hypothetical protein
MELMNDASEVKQLQLALNDAQALAFEFMRCAIDGTKPSASVLKDYGTLLENATAATAESFAQPVEPMRAADDDQWFGDMLIMQVLADSENVNEQEREVLQRWILASQRPSIGDRPIGVLRGEFTQTAKG